MIRFSSNFRWHTTQAGGSGPLKGGGGTSITIFRLSLLYRLFDVPPNAEATIEREQFSANAQPRYGSFQSLFVG